jgi:hypothetical protein
MLDEVIALLVPAEHENSIQQIGDYWELRFDGETGRFPVKDNRCITWLARLLYRPRHKFTVVELRADLKDKTANDRGNADMLLGTDNKFTREDRDRFREELTKIENRIADLEVFCELGTSTTHEDELQELIRQKEFLMKFLRDGFRGKKIRTPLSRAYHTIASQIRKFIGKLTGETRPGRVQKAGVMPNLGSHLVASVKLAEPHCCYTPPAGFPAWRIQEN